jgi:predicted acetyltransferase
MILREMNDADQSAFENFLSDWDGALAHSLLYEFSAAGNFGIYLKTLKHHVGSKSFFAFEDDVIVGIVSIRHGDNHATTNFDGHIGFAVVPEHRQKGYASEMLKQSLRYCWEFGLNEVLVICDESNIISARVIMKNGGILQNITGPKKGPVKKMHFLILPT